MAYNPNKDLKLFYSISEVAQMFNVNESLLRFWEREFEIIKPKKSEKGARQYRKEDVEIIRLIYHLVKEKGMTLQGARQKMKDNKEDVAQNYEVITRLQGIKDELLLMKKELDLID